MVAGAILALAAAFGIGFFAGNAGDTGDEPVTASLQDRQGGGGVCRRASALATDLVELQRQGLANRTEFTQAALSGDEGRMVTLNQELQPLSAEIEEAQAQMDAALERCARRGGKGKGDKGNEGGGGGGGG